jgi:hypothetical protein
MNAASAFVQNHFRKILIAAVGAISAGAWLVAYLTQTVLVYNDSMSHLNISRLVVDSIQPGFAQLGSVWLPLNHVFSLPFVWSDWAWQTGLAGSVVSMASFIIATLAVYGIVIELTGKRLAALIGAAAAALNVNFLYLQATPLTEPLYVALFAASVYFLAKYLRSGDFQYLLPLAITCFMQVLTRYDGWFVSAAIALVVLVYELKIKGQKFAQAVGHLSLFALPVAFGCLLWFGWNLVIFGDPLYFATGPYSAHAQQAIIEQNAGLVAKHNLFAAVNIFGYTVAENIGWLVLYLGLSGWLVYLYPRRREKLHLILAVMTVLVSVIIFNILSLFLGFSIINIPQVSWKPFGDPASSIFNVRYGIMALPFIAVGVGLFVTRWRIVAPIALMVILAQAAITLAHIPITLQDGTVGSSAFRSHALAQAVRDRVQPDDKVLVSLTAKMMPVTFKSELEMRQFVHEGATDEWNAAVADPHTMVDWILLSPDDGSDAVTNELITKRTSEFLSHYELAYQDQDGRLYQLKNPVSSR